jgi:phage baseplate assembly protein gpV
MIEQIKDIEGRLRAIEEGQKNILRFGHVVNRDEKYCRCRVQFEEQDKMVSYWCQVLQPLTHHSKVYTLPRIGDPVICLMFPFGHEQGFIVGSHFNKKDLKPVSAQKDDLFIYYSGRIILKSDSDIYIISGKNIRMLAGEEITIRSKKDMQLKSEMKMSQWAEEDMELLTNKNLVIEADQKMSQWAQDDMTLLADKNVIIEAGEKLSQQTGSDMTLKAGGNMTLDASRIDENPSAGGQTIDADIEEIEIEVDEGEPIIVFEEQ